MSKKLFTTQYRLPSVTIPDGKPYVSFVIAETLEDANTFVAIRGLGEEITSAPMDGVDKLALTPLNEQLDKIIETTYCVERVKLAQRLLHAVIFLLHIGESSGRYRKRGLFHDHGLVHQIVHLLTIDPAELGEDLLEIKKELNLLQFANREMFNVDLSQEDVQSILAHDDPYKHT
jgi:hypothetical protein